ncbi:hypothetical protein FRC11_010795, partial [Ceratobasidium sp. 423]
ADKMDSQTKAKQWHLLCLVMPVAYFEAWRVGDTIPIGDIPRGGWNMKHFKAQMKSAWTMYLTHHQVTLGEIHQGSDFLELVGIEFNEMNIHLTLSFHAMTHLPNHICKYGSVYNTLTAWFEHVNQLLANVNTNGHGHRVLEATMAKGFLHCTECYHYVTKLQAIEEPLTDDTVTTEVLLKAMRNGPEHEVQQGMLDAVLAGEAPMHGQERIRLATTSAQVNFRDNDHWAYYALMIQFCNQNQPPAIHNVVFYGLGLVPEEGAVQYGVHYGSANHYCGLKSRYGYINDCVLVLIQGIYETTAVVQGQEHKFLAIMVQHFVAPDEEPPFPWNHWPKDLVNDNDNDEGLDDDEEGENE